MSALDHPSPLSPSDRVRSTDLGRFKLKKKGNKSLEGLTRIASDGLQYRDRAGGLGRVKLTRRNSNNDPLPKEEKEDSWLEQSTDFTLPPRGATSTDTSQGSKGQLSYEEQRELSYDSMGSSNRLGQESTTKSRRASRGYQSRRAELYKSRSKVTVSESVASETDGPVSKNTYRNPSSGRGYLYPPTSQEKDVASSSQSGHSGSTPSTPLTPTTETPPCIIISKPKRKLSLGSRNLSSREASPPKPRPPVTSADRVQNNSQPKQLLRQPFSSEPPAKIPIFKTRSIGAQVVREVNIEDAIEFARSQATQGEPFPPSSTSLGVPIPPPSTSQGVRTGLSSSRRHSIDTTLVHDTGVRKTSRQIYDRGVSLFVSCDGHYEE